MRDRGSALWCRCDVRRLLGFLTDPADVEPSMMMTLSGLEVHLGRKLSITHRKPAKLVCVLTDQTSRRTDSPHPNPTPISRSSSFPPKHSPNPPYQTPSSPYTPPHSSSPHPVSPLCTNIPHIRIHRRTGHRHSLAGNASPRNGTLNTGSQSGTVFPCPYLTTACDIHSPPTDTQS
jgi:hypothetical protein